MYPRTIHPLHTLFLVPYLKVHIIDSSVPHHQEEMCLPRERQSPHLAWEMCVLLMVVVFFPVLPDDLTRVAFLALEGLPARPPQL